MGLVLDTPDGEGLILVPIGAHPFEVGGDCKLNGRELEVEGSE